MACQDSNITYLNAYNYGKQSTKNYLSEWHNDFNCGITFNIMCKSDGTVVSDGYNDGEQFAGFVWLGVGDGESTAEDPTPPKPEESSGNGVSEGTGKTGNNLLNQTKEQLLKSKASYEELIQEHEQKLQEYIDDPYAFDNKGLLKNAPSDEIRQKIIQGRISQLKKQIQKQQGELNKINNLLNKEW